MARPVAQLMQARHEALAVALASRRLPAAERCRTLTTALVVLALIARPAMAAPHICWIERAVDVGGAMRVAMSPGYESAPSGVVRADRTRAELDRRADGTFELKEGETVFLSTVPHDACTATAVRRDGRLGLALKANNCAPGIGCRQATAFVADE